MAKTFSPLWSLKAWKSCQERPVSFWCGSVGSGVFRRERNYTQLERYYVPFNPRTEFQQEGRSMLTYAVASWQGLPAESKEAWNYYQDYRRRRPIMSGYNLYISKFLLSGGDPKIPPSGRREDIKMVGSTIKCGQSFGLAGEVTQVDFDVAFGFQPHVVLTPFSDYDVWLVEVTKTYFKWGNADKGANVTVDWLATDCGKS